MNPRTFVPPTGLPDSKIMLVGEQPGKREVQLRKPFCGPAGKELKEDLHHAGIPTTDCYFTNVVKDLDKPLAHYIDLSKGKPRVTAEGQEYINRLRDEIQVEGKGSNVIVAVGAIALFAITGRMGITKWRGSIIESTLVPSKKVIPVIHPATVMPPKNVYTNKYLIVMDLVRAKEQAEFPEINLTLRNCVIDPSFEQAMGFLDHCYKEGLNGAVIDADIEVVCHTLSCISFAYDEYNAISIPFYGPKGDYFTINQEAEIMKKIEQILSHPLIVKAGQNFIFDIDFLMTNYGIIPRGPLYDTMIAQRISMPDLPAGLDFIASIHTDIPYYKEEGKRWMKVGGSFKQFWNYNAMDAISTAAARESQLTIIHQQKNTSTLSRKMNSHYPYLYMMQRGTLVDIEGMKKKRDETEDNIDKLREKLAEKAGYAFNPNSPQQVMHYFHNVKGLKPYMKRGKDGWTPTSDEDAMKRHARNGIDEARIILDIRGEQKRLGTYLDVSKVDPDGRIRGQYSPHKTVTGRPSSSQNIITKTGTNMQNWPHDLLSFLIPDPGYWYVSIDLSQIENRIVAYVGRVLPMIEAFENEIDVHRLTAAMIFSKPFDEVSDEPGSTTLGDGRHSERDWGKQANHCHLKSAEVLTPEGWVSIAYAKYHNIDIAQWDKDGTISFVNPTDWFEDSYSGDIVRIGNQRIFQQTTPNHKMPVLYEKGYIVDKKMSEYPNSGKYRALLSGNYSGGNLHIPDTLIMLLVAFQADGNWNGNGIIFTLGKQRKINRLKDILDLSSIPYTDTPSGINISAKHDFCKLAYLLLGKKKLFSSWLLNLNLHSINTFINELPYWDGYLPKTEYFTTIKQNAKWVQTMAHLCGKAANISIQDNSKTDAFGDKIVYTTRIRETTKPATSAIRREVYKVDNEKVYCPTVPSGYFLVKERGKISVTGNSLNYDFGYKNFALKYEIPEAQAKWMVEKYHRSYPEVREGFHALVKTMLQTDRYLTNLYGRRRKFLDKWDNQLFKDAYAHIPQSTTADKIDEEGLNYIYYNQDMFKPIELLNIVHDSVGFQIPVSVSWERQAKMIKAIKDSLETPLVWRDREFTVPADVTFGLTLNKEDGLELKAKNFPSDTNQLATKLRDIYQQLTDNRSKEVS